MFVLEDERRSHGNAFYHSVFYRVVLETLDMPSMRCVIQCGLGLFLAVTHQGNVHPPYQK